MLTPEEYATAFRRCKHIVDCVKADCKLREECLRYKGFLEDLAADIIETMAEENADLQKKNAQYAAREEQRIKAAKENKPRQRKILPGEDQN